MIRKILCVLVLCAAGCFAQNPISPEELNSRIEWQVRNLTKLPPYVKVRVVDRKDGSELLGFDTMNVEMSAGEQKQSLKLLISKDNRMLLSAHTMDLTVDVIATEKAQRMEMMSKIDLAGRPVRGNKDAKVLVVVYDDYQCPYCSKFHQTILDILKSYGDRIKVVYKDFPLTTIHPWAERAAIDSECLASQNGDAYWEFVDGLHSKSAEIVGSRGTEPLKQVEGLDHFAAVVGAHHGANLVTLESCIKQQPRIALDASMAEGDKLEIEGTPAIFINGERSDGAVPDAELRSMIDAELAKTAVAAPGR